MKPRGKLAWLLFALWGLWLFALQGLCASHPRLGPWVPELGVVLLFALDERLESGARRGAACVLAASRVVFSAEPLLPLLAAYLGVSGTRAGLRSMVEVDRALVRAPLAAGTAFVAAGFWILCQRLALADAGIFSPEIEPPWRLALSTGLAVLFALPLVRRLPGLSPLTERRR